MDRERRGRSPWMGRFFAFCAFVAVLGWAGRAVATGPIPLADVPPELRPWVPWVLDGLGDMRCPQVGTEHQCFWPGTLEIEVGDGGATFALGVVVDYESAVPLPGSRDHWPEQVRIDDAPAVVLGGAEPWVVVPPGAHPIRGSFVWSQTPESLPIPESIGVVTLRVRGQEVPQPRRDKADSVWLGRNEASAPDEPERVDAEVFRRLDDGVPFRVSTVIVLRVSGRARELALGRPLLAGSRPLDLHADIPVRLDENGTLYAQVRAGEHEVTLDALLPTPPTTLRRPASAPPWPEQEVWVWAPAPTLRQVQLSGLAAIDPARTNLPKRWRDLSAYVAGPGAQLTLATVQRGQAVPPPNTLNLSRELWLDADGRAFTVRDKISGEMHGGWRLDLAPGELGHVRFGSDDQLITVGPSGHRGIEVRSGQLDVVAEWRLPSAVSTALPAGGWSEDLEGASIDLHLPPGWRLMGAWGVDEATHTWLDEWNLFGLVYVLLVALATARLTSWRWGLVALVALALDHEYDAAPYVVWAVLLGLLAVARAVGDGVLRRLVGFSAVVTSVVLVALTVPFVTRQLRQAAFPEPEGASGRWGSSLAVLGAAGEEPPLQVVQSKISQSAEQELKADLSDEPEKSLPAAPAASSSVTWSRRSPTQPSLQQQLDMTAIVQTGPGIPAWSGASHQLLWHGPVRRDATVRLFVLAPWQNGLLGLLRAVATLVFAAGVLVALTRAALRRPSRGSGGVSGPRGVAAPVVAAAVLLAVSTHARPAAAEIPSDATLAELKTRLTRADDCAAACLSVPALALAVRDTTVSLDVEVHVGRPTAYQLPGPASSWVPRTVEVDGEASFALALRSDGYLYLRLEPGRHRVQLAGPVGSAELTLTLGDAPRRVTVEADGWEVDGVRDGRVEGSLHLARKAAAARTASAAAEPARVALPPWLLVHRELEVGVTWRLRTRVERVSRADEPLAIRFPLLPGEEVTESTLVAEGGVVLLSLGRDQKQLEFTSVLQPVESLAMIAARGKPWSEVWSLECGAVWHCSSEGVAPDQHQERGIWRPRFRPWPGEQVTFHFTRPGAAPGVSTTIDRASVDVFAESGLTQVDLTLRTSTGGVHVIELPADATVMTLEVDGKGQPIQVRDGKLSVVLAPGEQAVKFSFRHDARAGLWLGTPPIHVGAAVNAKTSIELPPRRFAIFTTGPGRGGVVLFWGALALLVLAAVVLSSLPYHPLRRWEWALLAVGFPLVPWPATAIVAAWLFLIGWRATWSGPSTPRKNLVQALLVGTTLVAGVVVLVALHAGLVDGPDPLVAGVGSLDRTVTFEVDRIVADATLPRPAVLTAPDWVWRLWHLAWAAWLARLLWRLGPFAWSAFTRDGVLGPWRWSLAAVGPTEPGMAASVDVDVAGVDEASAAPERSPVDAPGLDVPDTVPSSGPAAPSPGEGSGADRDPDSS